MRVIVIFILGLFLFTSCGRGEHRALICADSLMVSRHDSAFKVLKGINPKALFGAESRALYALLYTEAQYKSYDSITSDSLIQVASAYYSDKMESPYRYRSLMYQGAALDDMGMTYEAMQWYSRAEEAIDSTNYAALGLLNIRIASLYMKSYIENQEHIHRYKKALNYYLKTTDSVKINYLYQTIGQVYLAKNLDSAYTYLNLSNNLEYVKRDNSRKAMNYIYFQMYHYFREEYRESIELGLLYLNSDSTGDNRMAVLKYLSRAYANIGNLDSSLFYFNSMTIEKSDAVDIRSIYISLVDIERCRGDYKQALEYNIEVNRLGDSIRREAQKHNLFKVEKEFDKQQVEVKNKNKNLEYQSRIRLLIIVFMCLVIIVVVFVLRARHKRNLAQYIELIDYLKNESAESQNTLIEQLDRRNKTEQSLKIALENKLHTVRELIELSYRCAPTSDSLFRSKVNSLLKTNNLANGVLNDLREIVNAKYFGLTDHLMQKHRGLSDKDIQLLCLVCCNFSAIEMSVFFNYSNAKTIYSSKSRLCEKLNISTTLNIYLEAEIKELKNKYEHNTLTNKRLYSTEK